MPELNVPAMPVLASDKIFLFMEPRELFILSTMSKKTTQMIKSVAMRKPLRLQLELRVGWWFPTHEFIFKCNEKESTVKIFKAPERFNMRNILIEGQSVPSCLNYYDLRTYWNDEIDGLRILLKHFKNVFNIQAVSLFFMTKNCQSIEKVLDLVENKDIKLEKVTFADEKNSEAIHKSVIDTSFNNARSIRFHMGINNDFVHIPVNPSTLESIYVSGAGWFRMEHFNCLVNCNHYDLVYPKLTSNNLNAILQIWAAGTRSINYFKVKNVKMNINALFQRLVVKPITRELHLNEKDQEFASGNKFEIEGIEGKVASISIVNNKHLLMLVQ